MKVSEYRLLEEAWNRSFGFMLNRIVDVWEGHAMVSGWDPHDDQEKRDRAEDLCFNEFMCALEEMGVELGDVEAPLRGLPRPGGCVECGGDHGGLRHGQWLREFDTDRT